MCVSSLFRIMANERSTCLSHMRDLITLSRAFTGEKCLRMRRDINDVVDFRQSHWLVNVVNIKEEMAALFVSGSVEVLLPL